VAALSFAWGNPWFPMGPLLEAPQQTSPGLPGGEAALRPSMGEPWFPMGPLLLEAPQQTSPGLPGGEAALDGA